MPVGLYTGPNVHSGNGLTTVFAYDFKLLQAADLKVTVDGVRVTTGFTVSGVGASSGGDVTFSVAPASGSSIVFIRNRAYTRSTDYQRNGSFDEATVDADFDATIMLIQQLKEVSDRSLVAPPGETLTNLPAAADRASLLLAFDASGNPIASAGTGGAATSAFMATVLDDATAADALTTLGVSAFAQTLLDDVDAATARATLGASTVGDSVFTAASAAAARTALALGTAAVEDVGTGVGNVLQYVDVGSSTPGLTSLVLGNGGNLNPAVQGAAFNVESIGATDGGDYTAWFRRQSSAVPGELLIRLEHFSLTGQTLPIIAGIAQRGTVGTPVALASGDALLVLDGRGQTGAGVQLTPGEYTIGITDTQAQIALLASEAWTQTTRGTRIDFMTTPNGTETPLFRMRLDGNGRLLVGTTTTTGTGAGDIVVQNDRALRVINAAGTGSVQAVQVNTGDAVILGDPSQQLKISGSGVGNQLLVSVGAADSAGAGFRLLRVPN